MVSVAELWLPVLLSSVAVFFVSSLVHMVLPVHKADYKQVPDEDEVMSFLREKGVRPGDYMFPLCESMKEMAEPEYLAKMKAGPVAFMTVLPNGPANMSKMLGQWFALTVVISLFAGYVASIGHAKGAAAMDIFRTTSTLALATYGISSATNSIWKGVAWSTTCRFFFDGLLYALATGAIFAWMWPA